MKKLLFIALFLGSFNVIAEIEEMDWQGKTVEEKKVVFTQILNERISHFNQMKSCISNVKTEADLQGCRQNMRSHRQQFNQKWPLRTK